MIDTVLFDLDGTLLPMDNDLFTRAYFKLLVAKLAPYGYDPQQLIDGIWSGTGAMIKNDGTRSNESAFWDKFASVLGEKVRRDEPIFRQFYENEFQGARQVCGFAPESREIISKLRGIGIRVALATNPIFPAVATESRMRWAGLSPEDFELYTTYENIGYCKPNPEYYRELLRRLNCRAENCLMVGNDADEDMVAEEVGMKVFLLSDCLINKSGKDVSAYPQGSFQALNAYIDLVCG